MKDKYITAKEAALRLHVSRGTLSNWVKRGLIQVERYPSGRYRIRESAIFGFPQPGGVNENDR